MPTKTAIRNPCARWPATRDMKRRAAPFSNDALMAEFVRIGGSGRPEDAIRIPHMRLKLLASLREQLRNKPRPRPRPFPTIDLKRRQANDLD